MYINRYICMHMYIYICIHIHIYVHNSFSVMSRSSKIPPFPYIVYSLALSLSGALSLSLSLSQIVLQWHVRHQNESCHTRKDESEATRSHMATEEMAHTIGRKKTECILHRLSRIPICIQVSSTCLL